MSTASVSVIDYGVGNLGSVMNMFRRIDVDATLVKSPDDLARAERLLLPGVGSFDRGVDGLEERGLVQPLEEAAASGVPLLGICLGMQLLTLGSEEGERAGLGLVDAFCARLQPDDPALRVPHMGWNWIRPARGHTLLQDLPEPSKFYFAHSFKVVPSQEETSLAYTDFGGTFTSMVITDNICGAQFHPEKSHKFGMTLLGAFARWTP